LSRKIQRQKIVKKICAELNKFSDLKPTLDAVLTYIQKLTCCEAAGIRLSKNGDYPYYAHRGYSEGFIRLENNLYNEYAGEYAVSGHERNLSPKDCLCVAVLDGRISASEQNFTSDGSFWSNNITAYSEQVYDTLDDESLSFGCVGYGYNSLAVIPIKSDGKSIGLLQVNDRQENMFIEEIVVYLEMIGEQIGFAVKNKKAFENLQKALDEINLLRGMLPICAHCKRIRDDKGYWHRVEEYIEDHSNVEFTHGLCPDCLEKYYPAFVTEMKTV